MGEVSRIVGVTGQVRNQDFMWGGANEAKVDQTTEMYFLLSDPLFRKVAIHEKLQRQSTR